MDKRAWPLGIRPSGNGIQIRIWRNREIVYEKTIKGDPNNARDLASAVKRRKRIESRLILGLPLFDGDTAETETVAVVCQNFLDALDADDSTHIGYENIFNRYWLPVIGSWPKEDLTQKKVKEVLASMKHHKTGKPLARKTKRNILSPLHEAFKHDGITPNPVAGVMLKKDQKDKVERYTPDQRDRLLKALEDDEDRLYYAILFGCGLRPRGEPLALEWSDYNGEELSVSKQMTKRKLKLTTKTSQVRRVYVPKWVRPLLDAHPTKVDEGYIFLNSRGDPHKDADKFIAAWKEAHRKCRIPYRTPYKCRHTRASELLSQGVEPAAAAKQMGHSVEMFFRIYADFIEEFSKNRDRSAFEGLAPCW
jgi:integrase